MAALLKNWREAASLIIIAPSSCFHPITSRAVLPQDPLNPIVYKENGGALNTDYKTLLLKRSGKTKFMPNNYVFPGGVAVDNDFSPEWISVFRKVGKDFQLSTFEKVSRESFRASPMITRSRDPQFSKIPPDVAFRICAIRETFEESGLLIVRNVKELQQKEDQISSQDEWKSCTSLLGDGEKLEKWRKQVNENPNNFLKMCQELDIVPDISALYEWSNWLTPTMAFGKKRFDTIFYLCCLDHMPKVETDNTETVHSQWVLPSSLLSDFYNTKEVGLAPPQIQEMSRMLNFRKASELMKFSAERESERVERWLPVVVSTNDFVLTVLTGDDLYPKDASNGPIQFDMTLEEVHKSKNVKNFHRFFHMKDGRPFYQMNFNIVLPKKHVGPILTLNKKFAHPGKL